MDENNVFNSFSFQKWADYVRKEKIENEILRQRMEQVTRLRSKLVRERHLRDQADLLTDEDIDKLIGYLGAGYSLNGGSAANSSTGGGFATIPRASQFDGDYKSAGPMMLSTIGPVTGGTSAGRLSEKVSDGYTPKDDEYIFNEIKQFYAKTHSLSGLHGAIPVRFKYNHRNAVGARVGDVERAAPSRERRTVNPKSRFYQFAYNRRFND